MEVRARLTKLPDGGGLWLIVQPDGSKRWRLSYGQGGKGSLPLGAYPAVSLAAARKKREAANELRAQGKDPAQERRAREATEALERASTFGSIAAELIEKKRREGRSVRTVETLEDRLRRLALPALGARPIKEISTAEILDVCRQPERRGHYQTAQHLRGDIGMVFRFAIASGYCKNDPTTGLRGALTSPKVTHHAAITDPRKFGELLRAIDAYQGRAPELCLLLQLLALTFVRPGELRAAEWSEFSLDGPEPEWRIPAERMKAREEHRVPLARQALALLRELKTLTGGGRYLFPAAYGRRDRPMAANALNGALARLGFSSQQHTPHGFRASASSQLRGAEVWDKGQEQMVRRWTADAVEFQLHHIGRRSKTERSYDRDPRMAERTRLMTWWADECDRLRADTGALTQRAPLVQACAIDIDVRRSSPYLQKETS